VGGNGRFWPSKASSKLSVTNQILDRLHAAVEGLGDLGIGPSPPISIRLEQDMSATNLLR
jgi:hypothetical protein